jgi:hypothetical protein
VTGVGSQSLLVDGTAVANDANVLTVSSMSTAGLTLRNGVGGVASNYVLPAAAASVVINRAPLAVSLTGSLDKEYDGTTNASLSSANYLITGFVSGQGGVISQTSGLYNSANASVNPSAPASAVTAYLTGTLTPNAGTNVDNYILPTSVTRSASITPATITITAALRVLIPLLLHQQ